MKNPKIPSYVDKYFLADNLDQLDCQIHQQYITEKILNLGDKQAINWLFRQYKKSEIKAMLPDLKLNLKSKKFWELYFE